MKTMSYPELWHRLMALYDEHEAQAIVRLVLDELFGLSLADIYSGRLEELSETDRQSLEMIMQRLERAEPVQYVLGVADFCGRPFHVAPGVLIPRPETAELCQWVLEERGERREEKEYLLDIGTGSGCIAITLALDMPNSQVTGWDISDKALHIARENARKLGADVKFERCDILDPSLFTFHSSPFTTIVSNPPYIDEARERDGMAKNVLDYEPHIALFGPTEEPDRFYRRIGDYAFRSLRSGGQLFFELNPLTAEAVVDYLRQLGFQEIVIRKDQFGKNRFLKATKI